VNISIYFHHQAAVNSLSTPIYKKGKIVSEFKKVDSRSGSGMTFLVGYDIFGTLGQTGRSAAHEAREKKDIKWDKTNPPGRHCHRLINPQQAVGHPQK
jgi:hypothetical protein